MKSVNILYGPPGCGKTTVAELLPPSVTYLSVGRLARKEFDEITPLGTIMRQYIDNVEEYPEEVIQELVESPIISANNDILIDGFPKYEREVNVLTKIMTTNALRAGVVFNIELSLAESWRRIKDRKVCIKCDYQSTKKDKNCPNCYEKMVKRDDDSYEKFEVRFGDYEKNNLLVKSLLKKIGFEIVRLAQNTPTEYRDIIASTLNHNARVAQKRERLISLQEVDSSNLSLGSIE